MKLLLLAALAALFTVTNAETFPQTKKIPIENWNGLFKCASTFTNEEAGTLIDYTGVFQNNTKEFGNECCQMQMQKNNGELEDGPMLTYQCAFEDGEPLCCEAWAHDWWFWGSFIFFIIALYFTICALMHRCEEIESKNDATNFSNYKMTSYQYDLLFSFIATLLSVICLVVYYAVYNYGYKFSNDAPGNYALHIAGVVWASIIVIGFFGALVSFMLFSSKVDNLRNSGNSGSEYKVPNPTFYRKVRFNIA